MYENISEFLLVFTDTRIYELENANRAWALLGTLYCK